MSFYEARYRWSKEDFCCLICINVTKLFNVLWLTFVIASVVRIDKRKRNIWFVNLWRFAFQSLHLFLSVVSQGVTLVAPVEILEAIAVLTEAFSCLWGTVFIIIQRMKPGSLKIELPALRILNRMSPSTVFGCFWTRFTLCSAVGMASLVFANNSCCLLAMK